jgi:hypothetical protein
MVLIPDYFRGTFCDHTHPSFPDFQKRVTQWANLKKDFDEGVLPYAKKHGAETFACVGMTYMTDILAHFVQTGYDPFRCLLGQLRQPEVVWTLQGSKGCSFLPSFTSRHNQTPRGG